MINLVDVKTADLFGHALDWAVAKAEGLQPRLEAPHYGSPWRVFVGTTFGNDKIYDPHRSWSIAGPLIEKHCKGFGLVQDGTDRRWRSFAYRPTDGMQRLSGGETVLIAVCRAIVNVHIGDTVQVPKELMP